MVDDRAVAFALPVAISISIIQELEHNDSIMSIPSKYMPRSHRASKLRQQAKLEYVCVHLSEQEFSRTFRFST